MLMLIVTFKPATIMKIYSTFVFDLTNLSKVAKY